LWKSRFCAKAAPKGMRFGVGGRAASSFETCKTCGAKAKPLGLCPATPLSNSLSKSKRFYPPQNGWKFIFSQLFLLVFGISHKND
jgi:hypothetical protein